MVDWSFQDDCLDVIGQNQVGKIILPTGAGKSRIEFRHAKRLMVRDDGVHQVVIITAPRIILCQQLIKNFYDALRSGESPPADGEEGLVTVAVLDEVWHALGREANRDA